MIVGFNSNALIVAKGPRTHGSTQTCPLLSMQIVMQNTNIPLYIPIVLHVYEFNYFMF